jgi:hypothetical protein
VADFGPVSFIDPFANALFKPVQAFVVSDQGEKIRAFLLVLFMDFGSA